MFFLYLSLSKKIYLNFNLCPDIIGNSRAFFQQSVDINLCIFKRISNSGSGGVIYIYFDPYLNLRVKFCSFYECISNELGGAIYFVSSPQYFIFGVCVLLCKAKDYHFGYFSPYSDDFQSVSYLTISQCSYLKEEGSNIFFSGTKQNMTNYNSSFNFCYRNNFNLENSFEINFLFFSYFKNSCSYTDFNIFDTRYLTSLSYFNIIQNKGYQIFYLSRSFVKFYNCIFIYNIGYLFRNDYDNDIVLFDCVISHLKGSIVQHTYKFTFSPLISTLTPTFKIYHIFTQFELNNSHIFCQAELKLPDSTPFPTISYTFFPSPIETLEKTLSQSNTNHPSIVPSINPTFSKTIFPTISDTIFPTISDTIFPTISETIHPTISDTIFPTLSDTIYPIISDTINPSISDTFNPSISDTIYPIISDTIYPTLSDTIYPTLSDTIYPTISETHTFSSLFSNSPYFTFLISNQEEQIGISMEMIFSKTNIAILIIFIVFVIILIFLSKNKKNKEKSSTDTSNMKNKIINQSFSDLNSNYPKNPSDVQFSNPRFINPYEQYLL